MMTSRLVGAAVIVSCLLSVAGSAVEFDDPVVLEVAGRPLDVEHSGYATPCVTDFDGDGRKDLLVGEPYMGRLRIYRNLGTNHSPRFDRFSVFQDGAPEGRVPAG